MKLVKWSVQPKTMSSYQRLSESNDAPAPTPTSRYGHSITFLLLCAEFLGHVDANLCYVLSKWRNTFLQLSLIVNINRLDLSQCPYLPLAHGWPPDCLVLPRWVVGGWVVMQPLVVEISSQTPSLHPAPPPAQRKSKATQDLSGLSTNSLFTLYKNHGFTWIANQWLLNGDNVDLVHSSQQLPCLCLGSLEGLLELTRRPSRSLNFALCVASGTTEIQEHCQVWHAMLEGPRLGHGRWSSCLSLS